MLKKIFFFSMFLFLIFSFSSVTNSMAKECTFGYSYYTPSKNKVVLPCIDVEGICWYGEIKITPEGEIVLDDLINTNIEVPLGGEGDIVSYYDSDDNFLHIPELRIGGPFGDDDGPFSVYLTPYLENDQIKFKVDKIEYTMASNICEEISMKAVYMELRMPPPDPYVLPLCFELMGPKAFKDGWINIFKTSEANLGGYLSVEVKESCPKETSTYSCLYYIDETNPNNHGLMYLYWYEYESLPQINNFCSSLAVSGDGGGPLIFNEGVVANLLNLWMNPDSVLKKLYP